MRQLELQMLQFWEQLDHVLERRRTDREELSRIEDDLDRISEQLRNSGVEELGKLEQKRKDTERAIEGDLMERGACNGVIREKQARLRELESAIERHNATESKQLLAQRRLNAAREVIERITDSKQRFEAKFRVDLTKKVRALFDQISFTPYVPEITEDYALRLRESAGGLPLPVAASQGESQILSLCFIGGVIALAPRISGSKGAAPRSR